MLRQLIVTIIGDDKSGLLETLSEVVTEHKGNWLASNMSVLAGQFAGILQISVDDEYYRDLCEALSLVPGLTISFAEGKVQKIWQKSPSLIILDADRPGIVKDVSKVLALHDIEVKEITTHCKYLWQSNDNQFYAKVKFNMPVNFDATALSADLSQLSDNLTLELCDIAV